MQDIPNETNELGELKTLLFEEEMDRFHQLQQQIKQLQKNSHSIDEIVTHIAPQLDTLLLKRLANTKSHTIEIYAHYLAKIITKSTQEDLDTLSKSLQPVISPAIAKEIEDNQDKMVDALYPIMGGMISKYVSNAIQEMMEKINTKVEDGLSFASYRRKMKSKVSGVSESEILLQESHQAIIRSFFILDKESALLIAEEHIKNEEIDNPHMVASMAGAIKDFVNDWIVKNKEHSEIQLLSYGRETLYIESAGSVYLIAFLHTEPDHEQRREIQYFFAKIVKKYSIFFQKFNGDDSESEIREIKNEMRFFLNKQSTTKKDIEKKKNHFVTYLFLIFLAMMLIYLLSFAKDKYDIYQLEKHILQRTGDKISIVENNSKIELQGYVQSMKHYKLIEQIVKKAGYKDFANEMDISPQNINKKIKQLEKDLALLKHTLPGVNTQYKKHIQRSNKETYPRAKESHR